MRHFNRQTLLLMNATPATSTTYDISATFTKVKWVTPPTFEVVLDEQSGSATCDVDVNVSGNNTTFDEMISFTQASADTRQCAAGTALCWAPYLQVEVTLSAGANWNVKVYAHGVADGSPGA